MFELEKPFDNQRLNVYLFINELFWIISYDQKSANSFSTIRTGLEILGEGSGLIDYAAPTRYGSGRTYAVDFERINNNNNDNDKDNNNDNNNNNYLDKRAEIF